MHKIYTLKYMNILNMEHPSIQDLLHLTSLCRLNEVGEVIGMISMRALFGEGIGFAIPVDSIRSALPSLISKKKVPRPYIGLKMTSNLVPGHGLGIELS